MGTADRLTSKSAIPISLSQISLSGPIQLSFHPIQRFSYLPPRPHGSSDEQCTLHSRYTNPIPPVPTQPKNPTIPNCRAPTGTIPLFPASRGGRRSLKSLARTLHKPHPNRPANPAEKKGPEKPTIPNSRAPTGNIPFFPAGRGGLSVRLASFRFGDLRRSCA